MNIHLNLSVRTARLFVVGMIVLNIAIIVIHLINQSLAEPVQFIHGFLGLDDDSSFYTWVTSTQLLAIGVVFLLIAKRKREQPADLERRFPISSRFLITTGGVFFFLSMDEVAMFHERLNWFLAPITNLPRFAGDHGLWILLYVIAGIILVMFLWRSIANLLVRFPRSAFFLASGLGLLLLGGIALEILTNLFLRGEEMAHIYELEVVAEEFLEVLGASLILYGAFLLGEQLEKILVGAPEAAVTQIDMAPGD